MARIGPQPHIKKGFIFLSIIVITYRQCDRFAPSKTVFRRVRVVATVTYYPPYALCLSVHMDQRGSQWMDFSEVSYWRLL